MRTFLLEGFQWLVISLYDSVKEVSKLSYLGLIEIRYFKHLFGNRYNLPLYAQFSVRCLFGNGYNLPLYAQFSVRSWNKFNSFKIFENEKYFTVYCGSFLRHQYGWGSIDRKSAQHGTAVPDPNVRYIPAGVRFEGLQKQPVPRAKCKFVEFNFLYWVEWFIHIDALLCWES